MKQTKDQPSGHIDSPETFADWHMPWPSFTIDWRSTALVVVDMQNYGCNPAVGVAQMLTQRYPAIADYYVERLVHTVIPNAKRLLERFRSHSAQIVFTRHGALLPDGRDMIERRRRRDAESITTTNTPVLWHRGTFEHDVIAELTPAARDLVLDKNTSSAFNSTGIEWLLRNMGIESIVFVGMATDMCVETTARDAADRGFNAIIVEDASATFFDRHHRAALSGFARVFGQVWSTEQVLDAIGASSPLKSH
ncbi:MAG: cysteine hydrolase [Proteobacteria bacterium]|nr:cysteine hydrolase [Pseudomonadota bacterium]MBI3496979.1 cysteine hydrolase [Pseudomonadota bacterium]